MKNYKKKKYIHITIFREKKCYFHYDFVNYFIDFSFIHSFCVF
jgi:hypothetical protein